MPGKKKKYNARFPPARIKKIMQSDEEVGKVAAPVPVIISRTLELFVHSLLTRAGEITMARQARTLTPSHLKSCIVAEQRFDFLQEIFLNVPDIGPETDNDIPTPPISGGEIFHYPRTIHGIPSTGREPTVMPAILKESPTSGRGRGRGRGRPRKTEILEILPKRPRGRPRKIQSYICHEEDDEDDDDSENGLEIESSEEDSENEAEVFETPSLIKQPCSKSAAQENINTLNCSVDLAVKDPPVSSSCVIDGGIHITIPSLGSSVQPHINIGNNNLGGISFSTIKNTNNTDKSVNSLPPSTFKTNGPSGSPILSKDLSNNTITHGYGTHNGISGIPVPVITSLKSVSKLTNSRPTSCSSQTGIDEDYDC